MKKETYITIELKSNKKWWQFWKKDQRQKQVEDLIEEYKEGHEKINANLYKDFFIPIISNGVIVNKTFTIDEEILIEKLRGNPTKVNDLLKLRKKYDSKYTNTEITLKEFYKWYGDIKLSEFYEWFNIKNGK